MRKAQTATEYMIILAVVIVIALIAVSVLGGIPSIGGTAKIRASSSYWESADIGIVANSFGTVGGDDILILRNNIDTQITLTGISIDGTIVYSTPTIISPGGQKTITINKACGGAIGDHYSFEMAFNYTDAKTDGSYELHGAGHKLEGTCSS